MRKTEEAWSEGCGDIITVLLLSLFLLMVLALAFAGGIYILHCLGYVGQV